MKTLFLITFFTHQISFSQSISMATYNVENLFDSLHDMGKQDYTYLPHSIKSKQNYLEKCKKLKKIKWRKECLEADWTPEVADAKLKNLATVIQSMNDQRGPDVLLLQEVENLHILNRLKELFLKKSNYRISVLKEGGDYRGIDVAVLSRLRMTQPPILHHVPAPSNLKIKNDFRGILQTTFRVDSERNIHFLNVHFPAPGHPAKSRKVLMKKLSEIQKNVPKKDFLIAGGDFNLVNSSKKDQENLKNILSPHWEISYQLGCQKCHGTTYFPPKKEWSFFDFFLISKEHFKDKEWKINSQSIKVITHEIQMTQQGFPKSFDSKTKQGVSDHFPMYLEIKKN